MYVSQFGPTNSVITDFLPDEFPKASSPASSPLFNNVSEGQIYVRIKSLSLMAMMYTARLTRPDILLVISYLASKSRQQTDADYKIVLSSIA